MQAMILAAGLGTRLKPLTNNTPKALIAINDETLLSLLIKKLRINRFEKIIINVYHFAEQVITYLGENKNFNTNIFISDESNQLLDTGGGLKKAREYFDKEQPILIHNVDVISDIDLNQFYKYHISNNNLASLAVRNRKSSRRFLFDKNHFLCGWENQNTGGKKLARNENEKLTPLSFSGLQIVNPNIFSLMPDEDVFSLVDLYLTAAKNHNIMAYIHDEDSWFDVGNTENLRKAEKYLFNK